MLLAALAMYTALTIHDTCYFKIISISYRGFACDIIIRFVTMSTLGSRPYLRSTVWEFVHKYGIMPTYKTYQLNQLIFIMEIRYRTCENFCVGKNWQIWQIEYHSPLFYPSITPLYSVVAIQAVDSLIFYPPIGSD